MNKSTQDTQNSTKNDKEKIETENEHILKAILSKRNIVYRNWFLFFLRNYTNVLCSFMYTQNTFSFERMLEIHYYFFIETLHVWNILWNVDFFHSTQTSFFPCEFFLWATFFHGFVFVVPLFYHQCSPCTKFQNKRRIFLQQ